MPSVSIVNHTRPLQHAIQVKFTRSFGGRLRGLMFRKYLAPGDGLLMDQDRESKLDATIHMFFVPFDLGVIWLDQNQSVVDACLARAWRPFYMPSRPARYVLEIHPDRLAEFHVGDQLAIENAPYLD
jgi:uncharacterized membrane protein (UPF0127 family)